VKRSFKKFTARLDKIELRQMLEERSLVHHVSLLDLYEGPDRAWSIVAARKDVYMWLLGEGKSVNEIARIFDRAPSSVWKMTRKKARGKARAS
jgi:DNA-binding CsgD family transcriptional regulator